MTFSAQFNDLDDQPHTIDFKQGETVFMVGANGCGKTRLAAYVEQQLGEKCHRIAAHRAMKLKLDIPKIPRKDAENSLFGIDSRRGIQLRSHNRWGNKTKLIY